ncbi:hypothetical protein OG495_37100 (plasmid) [Streptomyces longwoodensis]|uniref:hypothetical protein n=1 Tax=Streptomyces longwoodensis TaxID=68231 RepID=UPI002F908531
MSTDEYKAFQALQVRRGAFRRRRERRAAEQRTHHFQAQLQQATDIAITAAVRARLAETVTDLHVTWPLRVTVGDVRTAARDHFDLEVSEADAAAMLRHRLERRGHAGWGDLVTDAYEYDD